MPATPYQIADAAFRIHPDATRLTTGVMLSPDLRTRLEALAMDCGMPRKVADNASDNDLIGVYLTALKSGTAAIGVAKRISLRIDGPDLLGEPPKGEPEARGPSIEAIRDLIARGVKEGALDPIQSVLESMAASHAADLASVPQDAAELALQAVRADMATLAHTAAQEALRSLTPTRLEIVKPDAPKVDLGLVHKQTAMVIAALSAGVNVYLYGPAGSGKTTLAEKVAQAFGLQAYYAAKVESEYQLLGFKDAKGETVRTQFREAYEHGGVFLFDELDGSSPSAVVALNMALANGVCPFPDGMIKRHAQFVCIAAGNTKLTGANRQYAGRNQLDAASIDRFAFIEFGYDDDLERALAADAEWCKYVQRVRAVVAERGLTHLVTPRATYDGCKLLAAGLDRETVAGMVVYKGLDADTRRQIEQAL